MAADGCLQPAVRVWLSSDVNGNTQDGLLRCALFLLAFDFPFLSLFFYYFYNFVFFSLSSLFTASESKALGTSCPLPARLCAGVTAGEYVNVAPGMGCG